MGTAQGCAVQLGRTLVTAAGPVAKIAGGYSMRSRILILLSVLLAVIMFPSGCGTSQSCLLCGTTVNDGVVIIDVMGVPGAGGLAQPQVLRDGPVPGYRPCLQHAD